ncbi:MAG: DMT family transporter [Polyangiaceae bacterium]
MTEPSLANRDRARVHAALATVQLLFALWPVAGASLLAHMTPAALVGVRLALGAPILALVAGLHRTRPPPAAELARLAGLGALGISVNQLLFVGGLARSGPVNASVAVLLIPPFTVGAALLFGRETFRVRRTIGVLVALAGGAALVGAERFDGSPVRLAGNAMLVANTASYALYLVLARGTIARLGSLKTVAWVMLFGALEALPFTLRPTLSIPWAELGVGGWFVAAFVVLGPTVMTYLLNAWALARAESSLVATYVYAQPPIAAVASWLVFGVLPSPRVLVAGVIIVAGLALATSKNRRS